jgi:hypothetical protein
MNRFSIKRIALFALCFLTGGLSCLAQSALITFDDFTPLPNGYGGLSSPLTDGYRDFRWSGFYCARTDRGYEGSGYEYGFISPPNLAFNAFGNDAYVQYISPSTPFTLVSAYLTAANWDNVRVRVRGLNHLRPIYDNSYTLSLATPTFVQFDYQGIDMVLFSSPDGIFVMDDLTVAVPEPPGISLLIMAGLGVVLTGHRIRRCLLPLKDYALRVAHLSSTKSIRRP